MIKPGRIPCVTAGCNRTADAARFSSSTEIICSKCWRLVPIEWKRQHHRLRRAIKKGERRSINQPYTRKAFRQNWDRMKSYLNQPTAPFGLDNFLEEMNLK